MLPFYIALKYFFARQKEKILSIVSSFSLIGVALGVATLIVVFAVMRGFHMELVANIVSLNSDIVMKPYDNVDAEVQQEIITQFKQKNKFIKQIVPTLETQALIMTKKAKIGVVVKGINKHDLENKAQIMSNLNFAKDEEFGSNNIILGAQLANNLGVGLHDSVQIVSSNSIPSIMGSLPRVKSFKVIGVFSSGMYDYDSNFLFMDINTSQSFFSDGSIIFEIYTDNIDKSADYALSLKKQIGNYFNIMSWDMINESFLNALKVERVVMFTILTLIIFIAAFNIISSIYILVKNKAKDIAILKTIGMSSKSIMMIFLFNGLMIGGGGVVIGVIIGTSFALNINSIKAFLEKLTGMKIFDAALYYLSHLPSKVYWDDVALISSISLGFCLMASLYPSYRASRMKVIEIMRNE